MILIATIILLLWIASAIGLAYMMRISPEGYQDENGFHLSQGGVSDCETPRAGR
jgi:hypothetical protein